MSMNSLIEEAQQLADELGFDLKKIPYGFQFRLGRTIVSYYETTGSTVISHPKQNQKVKKCVKFSELKGILLKLKPKVDNVDFISGEKAVPLVMAGVNVKHRRCGESEWRSQDILNLPLHSFLNKTFEFKIGGKE